MKIFGLRKHLFFGILVAATLTLGLVAWVFIPDGERNGESDGKPKYLDRPDAGSYALVDGSCEVIDWSPLRSAGIKNGSPHSYYTAPITEETNVKCSFTDTTDGSKRYAYVVANLFDSPDEAVEGFDEAVQGVEDLRSLATVSDLKGEWQQGRGVSIAGKQDDFATTKGVVRDNNLVIEFKSVIGYSSSDSRDDVRHESLQGLSAVSAELMAGLR